MPIIKNQTLSQYRAHIDKQLLDFDLHDIGSSCLPEKIFKTAHGNINGSYLLQVSVLNASHICIRVGEDRIFCKV